MGRTRRDCPLCSTKNLLRLANHLESVHGLKGEEKMKWLKRGIQPVEDTRLEEFGRPNGGEHAPALKDIVDQLPVWNIKRVLYKEGIHLF